MVSGSAVIAVICGALCTTTSTWEYPEQSPVVAVRKYVPVADSVALGITGCCSVLWNPLGPVHVKLVPLSDVPVSCRSEPVQTDVMELTTSIGDTTVISAEQVPTLLLASKTDRITGTATLFTGPPGLPTQLETEPVNAKLVSVPWWLPVASINMVSPGFGICGTPWLKR